MAVVGESTSKGTPAVYGTNSADGDAVFGQATAKGRGVVGVSDERTAVEGSTASGIGIYGSARGARGRGVVGRAQDATAIEGHSASGTGVYGLSDSNVGVYGRGGLLAAYFEGSVAITGDATIGGVSVQSLVRRLSALESALADRVGHGAPVADASVTPLINVSHQRVGLFKVVGSGFSPNRTAQVDVQYRPNPDVDWEIDELNSGTYPTNAVGQLEGPGIPYLSTSIKQRWSIQATDSRTQKRSNVTQTESQ